MKITKENYQDLVWDENISFDDYFKFFESLNLENKVIFLRFLLEHYPDYDDEWIDGYFDIIDNWRSVGAWNQIEGFADFVREKSPEVYKKEFNYLADDPVMLALFRKDLELAKIRFAETLNQPVKAIDTALRAVFNPMSADPNFKEYTTEVAEKIWKTIEKSNRLIEGAEFEYSAYLYCNCLEEAFNKIQAREQVDWKEFTEKVESINFKFVEEFALLPDNKVTIDLVKFHQNKTYRYEQLNSMLASFLYSAYIDLGIPVYWAFRTWFDWQRYLVDSDDAPKRTNWFTFTPQMLDKMGGNMYGMFGGNKSGMFIITFTLPYLYDFFLKQSFIDASTYARLMEYYDFLRRGVLKIIGQDLWKYKGLYAWKKPNYITEEIFRKEESLVIDSINWTSTMREEKISNFVNELPKLSSSAIPPPELSPFEKMMVRQKTDFLDKPLIIKKNTNKSKKKRKKKHKDNRKQSKKKKR